ncbi:MAG TPA: nuclear transport factor 2 family protein [Acidimicrobiales bacterium]|nr:nuclear transport factor 2 family protein [Acidimicrobiales bacterium]
MSEEIGPAYGPQEDTQSLVRILLDKQEIHEALMRYCRGIDRCDEGLILSAFHEDAMDNHTGSELPVSERVPRMVTMAKTAVKRTSHNICNELIDVDGDVAHSESYLIAYHRVEHEGKDLDWILGARYVDRFERRDGSWRIAHRTVVFDWQRFDEVRDPPVGLSHVGYFDQAEHGVRTPVDFSYQRLHQYSPGRSSPRHCHQRL